MRLEKVWFACLALLTAWSAVLEIQAQTAGARPNFRPVAISPRIAAVKKRLETGDRRVLDEFWQETERSGTPLIDPVKDHPREVTVTFVWRGKSGTQDVEVMAPLATKPGMPLYQLTRLLNTDLWYKCWQMRDDLRFTYRFSLNLNAGENGKPQDPTIDPLNSRKMKLWLNEKDPPGDISIATMPRAEEPQWITKDPNAPEGKVERHAFKSSILHNERGISVYTPPGYNANPKSEYRLLFLFDGFDYQHSVPTPTILDNLIKAGKLPPTVAVMIDNPREFRISELEYNGAFVDFVGKEVLPWVHEHWNVTRDPRKSIVGGLSLGGSASAFVALQRPDLFGNVISQSGSYWCCNDGELNWEWLSTAYRTSPKLPIRFFIEAGLLENISREGPTLLEANRRFVAILKRKGYAVTYEEVGGSHEPVHWRGELADGLMALAN